MSKPSEQDYINLDMLLDLEKRADKLKVKIRMQEIELEVIQRMIDELSQDEDDNLYDCDFDTSILN